MSKEQKKILLRKIGIETPTDEDIELIQFYMAGIEKEKAIEIKKICDNGLIPYELAITLIRYSIIHNL